MHFQKKKGLLSTCSGVNIKTHATSLEFKIALINAVLSYIRKSLRKINKLTII